MAKARKAPRRGASRAQPKPARRLPIWLIAACVAVVGLFIAFLFTLEPGRETVKRDSTPAQPAPAAKPEPPKRQSPSYDFYTLLPESEVSVPSRRPEPPPPPAVKPEPRPETRDSNQASTQYFLQAGSFRQRSEADRVRAQIILMGLDARLEDVKLANGEVWHRVQVGPFADQSRLTQAEQTLSGNGFTNLLRQQRSIR